MANLLDTLKERIVVFDGAMGTNLQVQNLSLDDFGGPRFEGCNENLLVTRPDAVEKVHAGFLDVGCDVVETNSFNGTPVDFAEYDIADKAYDMNVLAAQLAKRVAADYATKDKRRWVAGSMGPGRKLPTLGHISFKDLRDAYGVQVRGLLDGGVDLLIVETCQDLLQTKAALAAIFGHFKETRRRVPVIAQVTIEVFGTMLNGTEISAALTALAPFPIDVVGMNCGTGPKHMTESIRYICENSPLPVSVLPNATKHRRVSLLNWSTLQATSARTSSAVVVVRLRRTCVSLSKPCNRSRRRSDTRRRCLRRRRSTCNSLTCRMRRS
jgi:5-methyltetrahydrofolate--homocysteine methyltransferase